MCKSERGGGGRDISTLLNSLSYSKYSVLRSRQCFLNAKFFNTFVRPSVVWGNVVVFFLLRDIFHEPLAPSSVLVCAYYLFETLIRLLWASPVVCSDIFRYHLRALFCQNGWASELLSLYGVNSPAIFLSLMIILINPPNLVSASRLWKMSRGM